MRDANSYMSAYSLNLLKHNGRFIYCASLFRMDYFSFMI